MRRDHPPGAILSAAGLAALGFWVYVNSRPVNFGLACENSGLSLSDDDSLPGRQKRVKDVSDQSPAARAGLIKNDIIASVDGMPLATINQDDFDKLSTKVQASCSADYTVLRQVQISKPVHLGVK